MDKKIITKYLATKYLAIVFFFLLPLQTHLTFFTPMYEGRVWSFGVQRIFAMEIFLGIFLLALLFATSTTKSFFQKKYLWLIWIGIIFYAWAAGSLEALHLFRLIGVGIATSVSIKRFGAQTILTSFVVGMLLVSIFGAFQYLEQTSPGTKWLGISSHAPEVLGDSVVLVKGERILRSYGVFEHPNIFGGYLVVAIISVLLLFSQKIKDQSNTKNHSMLFIWLVIFFSALVWTFSRSAWLGLITIGLILYWMFKKKYLEKIKLKIKPLALLSSLGLIIIVFVISWSAIQTRLGQNYLQNDFEQRSISERVEGFEKWKEIFSENWLLGTRVGNYTADFDKPVHNSFLLALAEIGVIGSLFFTICFYGVFCENKKALILFLPFVMIAMFDHYLWSSYAGLVLVGLVAGLIHSSSTIFPQKLP